MTPEEYASLPMSPGGLTIRRIDFVDEVPYATLMRLDPDVFRPSEWYDAPDIVSPAYLTDTSDTMYRTEHPWWFSPHKYHYPGAPPPPSTDPIFKLIRINRQPPQDPPPPLQEPTLEYPQIAI